jgi:hypothetical protein
MPIEVAYAVDPAAHRPHTFGCSGQRNTDKTAGRLAHRPHQPAMASTACNRPAKQWSPSHPRRAPCLTVGPVGARTRKPRTRCRRSQPRWPVPASPVDREAGQRSYHFSCLVFGTPHRGIDRTGFAVPLVAPASWRELRGRRCTGLSVVSIARPWSICHHPSARFTRVIPLKLRALHRIGCPGPTEGPMVQGTLSGALPCDGSCARDA